MPLEKRSHSRFFAAARCDQLEQIDSESLYMTGWLGNYQQLAAFFADIVKGVRDQLGRIDAAARG